MVLSVLRNCGEFNQHTEEYDHGQEAHEVSPNQAGTGRSWEALPRCRQTMRRYEHPEGFAPKPGTTYLAYWDRCMNPSCRIKQVNPKEAYRTAPTPLTRSEQ